MGNQIITGPELAIIIGPSLAGAFILMAAIIGAVVFCVREKRRRKESQESVSSSASLFKEGKILSNFRLPMFNYSPSPNNLRRGYHDNRSSSHLVQPWAAGSGEVFTIPVTPSGSSKTSTIDSQSNRHYAINDTFTEKYYYPFSDSTNKTSNNSNPNHSTTSTTINNNSNNPNLSSNNSNTNDQNSALTTTNTPTTSSTTPEINSVDQVTLRKSRDVSKMVKAETPIRSTILTEDAWNSTLDDIFNSALSIHEPGTHSSVNVRGTVYPLMN